MTRANEDARCSPFNRAKNMKPKILIIGAGIGGLTSAIALRRAKFDVEVFERAPEMKEVGAGIALSPNAMRVLKHLGLMQQVGERRTVIKAAVGHTWRGREISRLATNLMDVPSVCWKAQVREREGCDKTIGSRCRDCRSWWPEGRRQSRHRTHCSTRHPISWCGTGLDRLLLASRSIRC